MSGAVNLTQGFLKMDMKVPPSAHESPWKIILAFAEVDKKLEYSKYFRNWRVGREP